MLPPEEVQISKIALGTGAIYSYSPEIYNPDDSWNKVIDEQFGENAEAMKVFAMHSRHMENSWAYVGPPDGPEFYQMALDAIEYSKKKKCVNYFPLLSLIDKMENSADKLLNNLPSIILAECQKQLEQFKRISQADRIAVKCLQDKNANFTMELKTNKLNPSLSEKEMFEYADILINQKIWKIV